MAPAHQPSSDAKAKVRSDADATYVDLSGWSVNQLRIDFRFCLDLISPGGARSDVGIVIESPFEFQAGQQKLTLEPAGQRQDLGPALSLWGMTAEQIRIGHNSDLEVRFERATVHVPADPNFEAWEVAVEGHGKWVARPGGGKPYEW